MSSALLRRCPRQIQRLHTSAVRSDRVAPPHPISHIRPIIYDDAPAASPPTLLRHPYSLHEFQDASDRPVNLELQFRLQRQQLDAFHQNFWLDVSICLLTLLLGVDTDSNFRAMSATTQPKKLSSPPYPNLPPLWTAKTLSPSSIPTGTTKRRSVSTPIPQSGEGKTLLSLSWAPRSSCRS